MSNNSATGGYLVPTSSQGLPGGLTLNQFIQTVIVGISGFAGTLCRPRWQVAPPKQPDLTVDWLAFGITTTTPDTFAYTALDVSNNNHLIRQELLEIGLSVYGPNAMENTSLIQDGFQITQNLEALQLANMGFVSTGPAMHIPDLVNERYIERVESTIFLRRQIQRVYPILPILSANGTVHTVLGNEEYLLNWQTG